MKRILFCLMAIVALAGCTDGGDALQPEATITLSTTDLTFAAEGGSQNVSFTSSGAWTSGLLNNSTSDWCKVSPASGAAGNSQVTITTTANETYNERSAVVTLQSGTLRKAIKVTQIQNDAIVLAKSEYEFGIEGGELDFEIKTNVDVAVKTSATWIKQVTTRALESKMLFFDVAANDAQEERVGTITLSGGNATQTITVKQSGVSTQPNNEIWYTSTDGNIVTPHAADCFGATIVSNTYENGKGIIKFDGDVTSIGKFAFWDCESLTEITIPNSVTSIGDSAFYNCDSLQKFYGKFAEDNGRCLIIDGILVAYAHASGTEYYIPNSVISIGEYAFSNCIHLTNVSIGNSVISIGEYAFSNCIHLTNVSIGNSVTSIGDGAFRACESLAEFKGKFASEDGRCLIVDGDLNYFAPAGLTEYAIPNSVTSIGDRAFYDCESLTSIIIPNSVTSIGDSAFYNCSSLTSIIIPNSVTSIGVLAFYNCSSLTSIIIPNSVTSIGVLAFEDCSSLTSIIIPNSVTSIGDRAFRKCSSLTSITIPNSVTSIGKTAFAFCYSLTSIIIPNSVTSIGDGAFYDCESLTSIIIPNSVTSIGDGAFAFCTSLQNIICEPTTPPTGDYDMFYDIHSSAKIYVPTGTGNAYKTAAFWSNYASIIEEKDM